MNRTAIFALSMLCALVPTATFAALPSGTDLQNAVAARRATRIAADKNTETPKEVLIKKPRSTQPLHTPQTRAEARKIARQKLAELRSVQERIDTGKKTLATATLAELKDAVLALTNAERKKVGLGPFKKNSLLGKSAQAQADDMENRNFFSHTNPDNEEPVDRVRKTGYLNITAENCGCTSWRYTVGENIAKGQQAPEEAVRDWMNSPPHRSAILSTEYTEIGIGIANEIWVQNFGNIKIKK